MSGSRVKTGHEPASVGLAFGDLGRIVDEILAKCTSIGCPSRKHAELALPIGLANDAEQPASVDDAGVELASLCLVTFRRPAEHSIEEPHGRRKDRGIDRLVSSA